MSTLNIKFPKFPKIWNTSDSERFDKWKKEVVKIIENQIKKDSYMMGGDLAYYFHIRPLLEALK